MTPTARALWAAALAALAALGATGCDGLFGVDFDDARRAGAGAGGQGGSGATGAGGAGGWAGPGHGWTRLQLLDGTDGLPHAATDLVRSIWCESLDRCLAVTEGADFDVAGNVYAATHQAVVALLFEGYGIDESVAFLGVAPAAGGVVARINRTEPLVRAAGDFMSASAWSASDAGDLWNQDGLHIAQMLFQAGESGSCLAVDGSVLVANQLPGAEAVWVPAWSPPGIPNNFWSLSYSDDLLCKSGPNVARGATGYISDDLRYLAFPAGNSLDDDNAGACVSSDAGELFRYAPLPEGEVASGGPKGLRCNDTAHCWLIGEDGSNGAAYVYYSTGVIGGERGNELGWLRASVVEGGQRVLEDIAFAPDNLHGFVVGTEAPGRGLLIASDDGGKTWSENLVAGLAAFQGVELLSVFALDADDIWVGGSDGLLMSNGRGGR
ncbi:MAG: YCF48-related protein [Polyangiaceae bacterium]